MLRTAHFFAPELRGLALECRVGPNLSLCFREPHHFPVALVPRTNDEIGIVLARSIAFVIRDRKAETFILEIPDDILRAVEEIRETLLEIRVAGDLVCVATLAVRYESSPLEATQLL